MTREEEIYNAMGDAEWKHIDGTKDIELFDMGFKEGAEWADAHPHWISAKGEKPKHLQRCLCYNKYMVGVYCYVYDNISKYWCTQTTEEHDPNGDNHVVDYADYDVTHWMPLPQPPSGSSEIPNNSEKDRIIGTAEHIQTTLDVINQKGE